MVSALPQHQTSPGLSTAQSHGRLCQAGNIHKPRFLQSQQLFHHRGQAHLQSCNNESSKELLQISLGYEDVVFLSTLWRSFTTKQLKHTRLNRDD